MKFKKYVLPVKTIVVAITKKLSHEQLVLVIGLAITSLILIFSGSGSSGGGHEHGHGGGGKEEEHEGEHREHGDDEEEKTVSITEDAIELNGIKLEEAKKRTLPITVSATGRVILNRATTGFMTSRFNGIVRSVSKNLGDNLKKDDLLATIESNENMVIYQLRAAQAGVVVQKDVVIGEYVTEKSNLFTIADLSTAWVELNIYGHDFLKVKQNQKVVLTLVDFGAKTECSLFFVSPKMEYETQTSQAMCEIQNTDGQWRPGAYVKAEILVEEKEVEIAVTQNAIQTIEGLPHVFILHGDEGFIAKEVTLGVAGKDWVEIKEGIEAGVKFVAENSFVLKAEFLKSTAGHDHG